MSTVLEISAMLLSTQLVLFVCGIKFLLRCTTDHGLWSHPCVFRASIQ